MRTQSAIQQGNEEPPQPPQPQVQQGGSSSSGIVRHVAGGILSGAGSVARGVASFIETLLVVKLDTQLFHVMSYLVYLLKNHLKPAESAAVGRTEHHLYQAD